MLYYLLCATPCAVKRNGAYAGRADANYSIFETEGEFFEIVPLSSTYAPASYFIDPSLKADETLKIYDMGGAKLLIPVFRRRLFSEFRLVGRKELVVGGSRTTVTCYAENGVRLIAENSSDVAVESLPFLPEGIDLAVC